MPILYRLNLKYSSASKKSSLSNNFHYIDLLQTIV